MVIKKIIKFLILLKISRIFKYLIRFLHYLNCNYFIAFFISKILYKIDSKNNLDKKKKVIFAINYERFLNDELKKISSTDKFIVYGLNHFWQTILLSVFWPPKINFNWSTYCKLDDQVFFEKADKLQREFIIRKKTRFFLEKTLFWLFKILKVDLVLSSSFYYHADYDFGIVAKKIGYPYVVYQIDRIFGQTNPKHLIKKLMMPIGKFRGTHMIVPDLITKNIMLEEKFIQKQNISFLGQVRMDHYLEKLKNIDHKITVNKKRKRVTLFSFMPSVGIKSRFGINSFPDDKNIGFSKLFDSVHLSFFDLAYNNSEIEFVIKTKWDSYWKENIIKLGKQAGYNINLMPNLIITSDINSHDLIFSSNVLSGFSSVSIIESALAKKPMIVPLFNHLIKDEYKDSIGFYKQYYLFDHPINENEYKEKIIYRLNESNYTIDEKNYKEVEKLFELFVSPLDGNALEKISNKLNEIINLHS